jgi:hypothetical protein
LGRINAICFIATGIHDVATPHITLELYTNNVLWYLDLLNPLCQHFVWIYNTSPKGDSPDYKQGIEQTSRWNNGVGNIIKTSQLLRTKSTIINLFNASIYHEHEDNIHMSHDWYKKLGDTFSSLDPLK